MWTAEWFYITPPLFLTKENFAAGKLNVQNESNLCSIFIKIIAPNQETAQYIVIEMFWFIL